MALKRIFGKVFARVLVNLVTPIGAILSILMNAVLYSWLPGGGASRMEIWALKLIGVIIGLACMSIGLVISAKGVLQDSKTWDVLFSKPYLKQCAAALIAGLGLGTAYFYAFFIW